MINLKTNEEIKTMRDGGKILATILNKISDSIKKDTQTKELDKLAQELILSYGAKPSFLGYNGYPYSICISINDEVVHGLPSGRIIQGGDLVSLDLGIFFNGFHLDSALTVLVESDKPEFKKSEELIRVAKKSLELGIKEARPGNYVGDISFAIESFVKKNNFSVVRELVGHGIGRNLHEDPQVPNFGEKGRGPELVEGTVIAIEPMISSGNWKVVLANDGFTYKTKDGSLAAHFEHTVAVTKDGPLVLTE